MCRGQLAPEQYRRIAAVVAWPFNLLALLSALLPQAAAIALELDHPVYDCFYLALSEARTVPLVTDDRRLLATLQPTGFNVQALQSWRAN